jgi:hypothetical protein
MSSLPSGTVTFLFTDIELGSKMSVEQALDLAFGGVDIR